MRLQSVGSFLSFFFYLIFICVRIFLSCEVFVPIGQPYLPLYRLSLGGLLRFYPHVLASISGDTHRVRDWREERSDLVT